MSTEHATSTTTGADTDRHTQYQFALYRRGIVNKFVNLAKNTLSETREYHAKLAKRTDPDGIRHWDQAQREIEWLENSILPELEERVKSVTAELDDLRPSTDAKAAKAKAVA